ncbi:MAG: anthranilate synthase component 2 [bacterium]|jgi:anthranilate synthase component 2
MIFLIDNYDSFTYNLYQYLGELGKEVVVKRNDKITVDEINSLKPEAIVLSPGPGTPDTAGICLDVIKKLSGKFPILGICLGHQSIGQAFGGKVIHAPEVCHGKTSIIQHQNEGVFKNLPETVEVGRYHSLIVEQETLPDCLTVTSRTENGLIMGFRHKEFQTEGIQFHPESVLTPLGKKMLETFVKRTSII